MTEQQETFEMLEPPAKFDSQLSPIMVKWSLETHSRVTGRPYGRIRVALRDAESVGIVWFPTDRNKYAIRCWIPEERGGYMLLGPVDVKYAGSDGVVKFGKKGNIVRIQAPFGDKAASSGGIGDRIFMSPLVIKRDPIGANETGLWLVVPYYLFGPNTLHLKGDD